MRTGDARPAEREPMTPLCIVYNYFTLLCFN